MRGCIRHESEHGVLKVSSNCSGMVRGTQRRDQGVDLASKFHRSQSNPAFVRWSGQTHPIHGGSTSQFIGLKKGLMCVYEREKEKEKGNSQTVILHIILHWDHVCVPGNFCQSVTNCILWKFFKMPGGMCGGVCVCEGFFPDLSAMC